MTNRPARWAVPRAVEAPNGAVPSGAGRPAPAAPAPGLGAVSRHLGVTAAYLAAWTVLDLVAARFEAVPGAAVLQFTSALDLVLLLLFGLRFWPLLLLGAPIHLALAGRSAVAGGWGLLAPGGAIAACCAGAAFLLVQVLRIDPGLRRRRDVTWFVTVAVGAAPLAVAALQVLSLAAARSLPPMALLLNVLRHYAGDATGIAMLAPVLLVAARRMPATMAHNPAADLGFGTRRPPPLARAVPLLVAECAGFLAAVWIAYGWQRPANLDYSFLSWVPMIWVSLRYGFERAAAIALVAGVAVAILAAVRFGSAPPDALQFGLLGLTATALLLGAYATEARRDARLLRHQALHDALTGLPNRVMFRRRLDRALAAPPGSRKVFAVAVLDLDDFKGVNDALGHQAGDAMLVSVARRLRAGTALGDVVARLGGDQFGLLLHLRDPAAAHDAMDRVLDQFNAPFLLDSAAQRLTASAGATVYHLGGAGLDSLMDQADLALRAAQDAGRAGLRFYVPEMQDQLRKRLRMGEELKFALDRQELVLHYQPQVDCVTGEILGAEALVRWMHPVRGLLMPGAFLEYMEPAGLMARMGGWVLRKACAQAVSWPGGIALSVNVAPAQWRAGHDLAGQVEQALARSGLPPRRLKLEITEDALVSGEEACSLPALRRLQDLGVRVSMDDFGTGHSGLSRLRRLPVNEVKIDRSFVTGIGRDVGDEAIVRTVVSLAQSLGHKVVAEGVETGAQLEFLRGIGCGMAQGYLFSRPLDADSIMALLADPYEASGRSA